MERKKLVIRLTNYGHNALHTFADNATEEQKNQAGLVDHWALKDHYAHIVHWMEHSNAKLASGSTEPDKVMDVDKENARIFEKNKNKPFTDTLTALDAVYEKMGHYIRMLSEEDLLSTKIVPSLTERPLWQSLLGDTCIHPISHLTCLFFETGNPDQAVVTHEAIVEDLLSLDESARWQGVTLYNLGCTYALSGKKEKAIELLAKSLKIHPDLKEWSQHDPDYECVRGETAYQQLYT